MGIRKFLVIVIIIFVSANTYVFFSESNSYADNALNIKDIQQPKSFLATMNDRKEYFNNLEKILNDKVKETNNEDDISIGYYNLETGTKITVNGDKLYLGASTIKVPLSMLIADNIKDNKLKLSDEIKYQKSDFEKGTGNIQYDNKKIYTVAQLQKYMLENSDNIATNMLVRNLGGGDKAYQELSKKYLSRDNYNITKNQINANYGISYLKYLYENPNNNEHYMTIIEHLKNTEFNNRLYTDLTKNILAHKIGSNEDYVHDIGIFYDEHPYILVVLTKGIVDAEDLISNISDLVYKYQTTNYLNQNNYNLLKKAV